MLFTNKSRLIVATLGSFYSIGKRKKVKLKALITWSNRKYYVFVMNQGKSGWVGMHWGANDTSIHPNAYAYSY